MYIYWYYGHDTIYPIILKKCEYILHDLFGITFKQDVTISNMRIS